jgi:SAM-dependent methyltransferase
VGIVRSNAAFYLEARARGVTFDRTLTLGRQRLYVRRSELTTLAARYRPDLADRTADLSYSDHADGFLKRFLDVSELEVLDHSAYEGASIIHDLNVPVPERLHEQFDVVIDSGTLEHVFNLPVAIASCMRLVKAGGTLFLSTPANNMCGHGFYQVSPELFFRLFKDANGFELRRLVLVTHPFPGAELSARQTWYEVRDPAVLGARAPLMTSTPAFLMLEARRVGVVPVLVAPPLQSDYVRRWTTADNTRARGFRRGLFRRLSPTLQALVTGWYQRLLLCNLRNREAFRRLTP